MEAEWWTGKIGDSRSGVFPFNYVKLKESGDVAAAAAAASSVAPADVAETNGAAAAAAADSANVSLIIRLPMIILKVQLLISFVPGRLGGGGWRPGRE